MILPCGVSRAPNRPRPGLKQRHVCGDEAVEKVARVLAADLDHAPIGKKRCFHAKVSCDLLQRNVSQVYDKVPWETCGAGYHIGT